MLFSGLAYIRRHAYVYLTFLGPVASECAFAHVASLTSLGLSLTPVDNFASGRKSVPIARIDQHTRKWPSRNEGGAAIDHTIIFLYSLVVLWRSIVGGLPILFESSLHRVLKPLRPQPHGVNLCTLTARSWLRCAANC